jgi:CspA family cold shock protein
MRRITKPLDQSAHTSRAEDVFVHVSDVERSGIDSLREGQKISFEVREDPRTRKSSATNLRAAS